MLLLIRLIALGAGKRLRQDEDEDMDTLPSTSGRLDADAASQRQYRGQRIETPSYPGEFAAGRLIMAVHCPTS